MIAISEPIPLPFSLFPSSSLIDSEIRPIHAANCSLRSQKSHIKLKEEWWGPSKAGFDRSLENKVEKGEETRESKRRKSARHAVEGSTKETSRSEKKSPKLDSSGSVGGFPRIEKEISSKSQDRPQEASSISGLSREHARASSLEFASSQAEAAEQTQLISSPHRISPRSRPRSPTRSSPRDSLPLRPATTLLTLSVPSVQVGLGLSDFEPFLTDKSIDPLKSFAFYRMQIEFLTSISNPNNWSNKPQSSVFVKPNFLPLQARIMSLQPNFEYIRKRYPLDTSTYQIRQIDKKDWIWGELGDVLDWLYGMRVKMDEILWFVEHAPQPLLAIARIAAITLRYSRGVSSASFDFARFLREQRSSQQSTNEKRARDLVDWLRTGFGGEKGQRWRNWWGDEVKRDREGRELKGRRWLDDVKGWRTLKDLEEWVDGRKAQGKWRMR